MFVHPNIIPQDTRLWLAREIKPHITVENSKDIPSNLVQYLNHATCLDNNYQVVVKLHKKKSFGSHITWDVIKVKVVYLVEEKQHTNKLPS